MAHREEKMKVYINNADRSKPRQLVEAEKVKETPTTYLVRLPDGNVISRKKSRDLPEVKEKDK